MSFASFIIGLAIFGVGFLSVWKTTWFDQNMGDPGVAFGMQGSPLMSWKLIGLVLMLVGFLAAFGILQGFIGATIGGLFTTGVTQ